MFACFGPAIPFDKVERNHRFLEEALELVQAADCTKAEALKLVEYVYGRPKGELHQEIGGVLVTLAALSDAHGADLEICGDVEIRRCWEKIMTIREKQAAKPKMSPLPAAPPQALPLKILRADRASKTCEIGEFVFYGLDAYGCANEDSRSEGIEHIAVSRDPSGIPFFTIPKQDVATQVVARKIDDDYESRLARGTATETR